MKVQYVNIFIESYTGFHIDVVSFFLPALHADCPVTSPTHFWQIVKSELQPSLDHLEGRGKLVLRDFFARPVFEIDDEPLLFIWLGDDVEVYMEDMLERNLAIVLQEVIGSECICRRL